MRSVNSRVYFLKRVCHATLYKDLINLMLHSYVSKKGIREGGGIQTSRHMLIHLISYPLTK